MSRRTVVWRVREHLERSPDRLAFAFRDLADGQGQGDVRISYRNLWERAAAFAAALEVTSPHPRCLIVMPLGTDLVAAHLGCLASGGIPAIHSHPSEKVESSTYARGLSHVIDSLRPSVVVTTNAFRAWLPEMAGAQQVSIVTAEAVATEGGADPRGWEGAKMDDIAAFQYSSGSTGMQKAVALTHDMICRQSQAYSKAISLSESDRICSWLPLYHDMGLFTSWLMPLLEGTPVFCIDPFAWVRSPVSILSLISEQQGTLCWQPNFAYNLLAHRVSPQQASEVDLRSMRGFVNCSEPVRAESHRLFHDRFAASGLRREALWACYAMAENAFAVSASPLDNPARVVARPTSRHTNTAGKRATARVPEFVSCGPPIADCEIRVVGEARNQLEGGEIGEIAIRSPFLFGGYVGSPEATAKVIDSDGWYYTGDIGFIDRGEIFITGRKKDLLIVGGRNFYPQDIEAVCDTCEGAVPGRSVAVGVSDRELGTERIVVLVESRTSDASLQARLARVVRQRVLEELDCAVGDVRVVPHMWLQKTSSGKIARHPNLERYQQQWGMPFKQPNAQRAWWVEGAFWAVALATAIYLLLLLRPSRSWAIYSGF
jgi:acyl-CoA synthetase (AMP-forming)/AMP-acid ligase II